MKNTLCLIIVFILPLFTKHLYGGYGDQVNGYPNQKERDLHLATNMVRVAPQQFKTRYIGFFDILSPQIYPPVDPIYLHYDLNRAGRAHAADMAARCGLSHTSCDGTTSWSTRIFSYYSDGNTIGENIATGLSSGFDTVIQFLRDDVNGTPAPDNSAHDGHRRNIMFDQFTDIGPGYAYSSSTEWYDFWVQDFGGNTSRYYAIAAGSHLYGSPQKITFIAVYSDPHNRAPQSAQVVINGVAYDLNLHLGNAGKGSYSFELTDDNDCRDYYFRFVDDDGKTWYYPESTELSNDPSKPCYTAMGLADAIRVLKIASTNSDTVSGTERIVDQNGDGVIGLPDAILILGKAADR